MESLIPLINQLQDICNTANVPLQLDLPQIVVVGAQSSGKSSVIESLVQREFLPRGHGLVTRRPLVIRLFKIEEQLGRKEWVEFQYLDKKFTNFDEVREEIERETDRVCGSNSGISSEPITLAVYSKNVVNLTLVDLPGLVKNPTGDQPEDIGIQVRELVLKYIRNNNSIILAVTAANTDLAISDAIMLAREVDGEGKRTLAVLTQLDVMIPGTDALKDLLGQTIPIRLGIIGVVNRSQTDILNGKSIQDAIADEAVFLQSHYPSIAKKNGQPFLAERLSQLLQRHIRACLPDLKARINSLISQYKAQLNSYGDPVTNQTRTIIDVITKFSSSYCDTIKGGEKQNRATELCGGARIHWIFHGLFDQALSGIDPLETLDSMAILTVARNVAGTQTEILAPVVFRTLVEQQIKRLEDPSLRCVELVHEEMGRFVKHCGDEVRLELVRFPKLREKIEEVLKKLLDDRLPVTRDAITNLVASCSDYIDTEHPRLRELYPCNLSEPIKPVAIGGDRISRPVAVQQNGFSQNGTTTPSVIGGPAEVGLRYERELRECDVIAGKIQAYFDIVREEIKVFVPRTIMRWMVKHIVSNLQPALTEEITCHQEHFEFLLSESDDVARRRKETSDHLVALTRASETINSIHRNKHYQSV